MIFLVNTLKVELIFLFSISLINSNERNLNQMKFERLYSDDVITKSLSSSLIFVYRDWLA